MTEPHLAEKVGALALVVILAGIAGCLIGLLGGFTFPKCWKFKGYTLNPVLRIVTIPPLLGQIIIGCVVRNTMTA